MQEGPVQKVMHGFRRESLKVVWLRESSIFFLHRMHPPPRVWAAVAEIPMHPIRSLLSVPALAAAMFVAGVQAQTAPLTPDIPTRGFTAPTDANDYVKRVVMIPMRDGVKLHTVIVIPKGAAHAPILLTRTPYHADMRAERMASPHMLDIL